MGFFSDIKESIQDRVVDRDCDRARDYGLYSASSHRYGCEYCEYVQRANCSTGLVCSIKNIVVCANLTCESFSK